MLINIPRSKTVIFFLNYVFLGQHVFPALRVMLVFKASNVWRVLWRILAFKCTKKTGSCRELLTLPWQFLSLLFSLQSSLTPCAPVSRRKIFHGICFCLPIWLLCILYFVVVRWDGPSPFPSPAQLGLPWSAVSGTGLDPWRSFYSWRIVWKDSLLGCPTTEIVLLRLLFTLLDQISDHRFFSISAITNSTAIIPQ